MHTMTTDLYVMVFIIRTEMWHFTCTAEAAFAPLILVDFPSYLCIGLYEEVIRIDHQHCWDRICAIHFLDIMSWCTGVTQAQITCLKCDFLSFCSGTAQASKYLQKKQVLIKVQRCRLRVKYSTRRTGNVRAKISMIPGSVYFAFVLHAVKYSQIFLTGPDTRVRFSVGEVLDDWLLWRASFLAAHSQAPRGGQNTWELKIQRDH